MLAYAVIELRGSGRLARLTGAAALGALPAAILLAAYDTAVMGAPWRLPFNVSGPIDKFGFGWRATFVVPDTGHGGQVHYTPGAALHATLESILTFPRFVFMAPAVVLLAGYLIVRKWRDPRVRLLVAMIATLVVAYFFWWGVANAVDFGLYRSLGPFYHYLALGPLAVLAAWDSRCSVPRRQSSPGSRSSGSRGVFPSPRRCCTIRAATATRARPSLR